MTQNEPAIQETAALVLFSGGQDSTTCLAWALSRFAHVETIGFDYGQRHRIERRVYAILDCDGAKQCQRNHAEREPDAVAYAHGIVVHDSIH